MFPECKAENFSLNRDGFHAGYSEKRWAGVTDGKESILHGDSGSAG